MRKFTALLACAIVFAGLSRPQDVAKKTFIYSVKGADTLRLDRYAVADAGGAQPCLIFMFGGGFAAGTRDEERYLDYFEHFARSGITVASIDYRLGFRPIVTGEISTEGMGAKDFLALFENSVFMAVEDLYDATAFILDNAAGWGIDSALIIASGSSAGAMAVLQGEYERANRMERAQRLPEDFRYAGVIAFAGAVYGNEGRIRWNSEPAPLLMFHGDADRNVPYGKKRVFKRGLYGSHYLARRYAGGDYPYWLYTEENVDHAVAVSPMKDNFGEMESFIRKYVIEGRNLQTETVVTSPDLPKAKKRFGIKNYVKANFARRPAAEKTNGGQ